MPRQLILNSIVFVSIDSNEYKCRLIYIDKSNHIYEKQHEVEIISNNCFLETTQIVFERQIKTLDEVVEEMFGIYD